MQQYKNQFKDESYVGTMSNIQPCIRLNDIEEIGDGTHLLYFNMIGLFSFRELTVKQTIDFWFEFLKTISIIPDYVTIHPDKKEWIEYYKEYNIDVREDKDCIWSDGAIGGYCTEFYKDGVEIGNIVNPLGTCIDVGFGLERLHFILTNEIDSKEIILKNTILKIIESGYKPSSTKQGYVLRKLLKQLNDMSGSLNHPFFIQEKDRQIKIKERYERLKHKHFDKSKEWWFDTHGINLDEI